MKTFLLILSGQLKTNIYCYSYFKLKRIIIHQLAVSKNNIKLNTKNLKHICNKITYKRNIWKYKNKSVPAYYKNKYDKTELLIIYKSMKIQYLAMRDKLKYFVPLTV